MDVDVSNDSSFTLSLQESNQKDTVVVPVIEETKIGDLEDTEHEVKSNYSQSEKEDRSLLGPECLNTRKSEQSRVPDVIEDDRISGKSSKQSLINNREGFGSKASSYHSYCRKSKHSSRRSSRYDDSSSDETAIGSNIEDCQKTEEIRRKLETHFSDPYTKLCNSEDKNFCKRLPEKLIFLILKWIFVTWQLALFASDRSKFAQFLDRNNIAMKHLLLRDWSTEYEAMPYPPASPYAVYTIEDLIGNIEYTVNKVNDIPTLAVGSFFVSSKHESTPVEICLTYFNSGIYNRSKGEIKIDTAFKTDCRLIGNDSDSDDYGFNPSIQELMRSTNGHLVRLLMVDLKFSIDSVHVNINLNKQQQTVQCFQIDVHVSFDNTAINGQITVDLDTDIKNIDCTADDKYSHSPNAENVAVFIIVFLLSCASVAASARSMVASWRLCQETDEHFKQIGATLRCPGKFEIFKSRDVVLILSDTFTIIGSCFKILLSSRGIDSSDRLYDVCAINLGIGCFLVWLGVLHYTAYDPVFHLLFDVVVKSASTVGRFLLCIGILFIGFALCGWAVLGPYHIKFESIANSCNCLLSQMYGDEIYITLNAVDNERPIVWYFNIAFNTFYILIFTLLALNIFIAIFNTTYDLLRPKRMMKRSAIHHFLDRDRLFRFHKKQCQDKCEKPGCCL